MRQPLAGIAASYCHARARVPGRHGTPHTDGLVETPGVDIDASLTHLAHHLSQADERDLNLLIDDLLSKADTAGQRTDDVAILVLHDRA